MEIERIDLYDFKIVLTEKEFNEVKVISIRSDISIEQAFAEIVVVGLKTFDNSLEKKE